jgi:hypothetical protein
MFRKCLFLTSILSLSTLVLAVEAEAASVYNCISASNKCVVKLEEGVVGDGVRVLDEKARVIANGRIIKRKGAYGVIMVTKAEKLIRRGYPVIVNVEDHSQKLEWAASFSNQE